MNPIQVGLLGIGTVGSGTFEVLRRNQAEIQRRAGRSIRIILIAAAPPSAQSAIRSSSTARQSLLRLPFGRPLPLPSAE